MGTELLNSPDAIAMARDKWMTLQRLVEHGIPVPPTLFSVDAPQLQKNLPKLGTPVVFKVLDGLQGAGVVVAESHRSAASMMDLFQSARTDFIAQTFIAESESADIRCLVLNGQVIAAMRRQGRADDFRSNLHRGGSATSIELTAEESHIAVAAADAIGLRLAGVDILRSKAGSLVIEVNASPGLEGIEGISLETIAEQIISTAVAIATI
jgi:ribosomal protein S6--L-glutamate ligase